MQEFDDNEKKDEANNDEQNCDIDFVYNDTDDFNTEIAEFYSYSEESDFHLNKLSFEEGFTRFSSVKWFDTSPADQHAYVLRLLDLLDCGTQAIRQQTVRSILYLLQGNFGDCELEEDQITWTRRNVYMLIEAGIWPIMIQSLLYEIFYDKWSHFPEQNTVDDNRKDPATTECATEKRSASRLADSADLRAILAVLYIIVETVRDGLVADMNQTVASNTSNAKLREQFCEELSSYVLDDGKTTLTVVLFEMINRFCSGPSNFPIKKVLLLLWKVILVTMGPETTMFHQKNAARARWNLPPLWEDTHQVIRHVRASSPPGNSANQILSRQRIAGRYHVFDRGNKPPKQGSLASGRLSLKPQQSQPPSPKRQTTSVITSVTFPISASPRPPPPSSDSHQPGTATPRPGSPVMGATSNLVVTSRTVDNSAPSTSVSDPSNTQALPYGLPGLGADYKALRWKPKVRIKDLENFLTNVRLKFVKFQVPNDVTSLMGLPEPIHEAVRVLREHLYTPLSEVQIRREQDYSHNPFSMGREIVPDTPVERLYRATYPSLPQYMVSLLRVLLAALPTSKAKMEPINILAEVLPDEASSSAIQSSILNVDIDRHRELIVKAISALLLLLLKHLKLNHVYQFEYVAQYLAIANCIPLILKFFNQNINNYIYSKNTIAFLDFPSRFIGFIPEVNADMLVNDCSTYSWRNLFASINLLRILNMLTKWKVSRTVLLVVFKSAPILKRILRVRHAMLQLYALKLLKLQIRYFGRQWRKNNMSIMSAIYQKVRHRLTDDWAYGNDMDAVPWRFQFEEHSLRTSIDQFNMRRYNESWLDEVIRPSDLSLTSVLSQELELSDEFKRNYERWLEEEVFSVPINWSQLLAQ